MPEIPGPVEEIAIKEASEGIGNFLSKFREGEGFYATARDLMKRSKAGNILLDHIDNILIPQSRKSAQAYFDAGVKNIPPSVTGEFRKKALAKLSSEAKTRAWGDARSIYFGKNDELLINGIYNATKEKGAVHGNMLSDALSYVFHDAGEATKLEENDRLVHGFRTRRVAYPGMPSSEKGISLTDVGIRQKAEFREAKDWEKALRGAAGWMNAPLIAIPHMSQVGGILLDSGFKATAKALADYSRGTFGAKEVFEGVMKSGVLFDEMNFEMQQDAKGLGIFEKMFHFPGFNWVRRQELTLGALAGKHAITDAAEKLSRDSEDKWARYTMEKLGLKYDEFLKNDMRLQPQDIERAMFKEANRSIMITPELDTPWKWKESAWARIAFQYKDFAYRYGRFISGAVKNSYQYGGVKELAKTLGVLGIVFPAMGEMVHSMENLAQLKNPLHRDNAGAEEYFSAMGYVGGLGIFNSLWRAGLYNKGRGYLEGPVVGDTLGTGFDIFYHGYKGAKALKAGDTYEAEKQAKEGARATIYKMGWPGRIIAEQLKDPDKK